MNSTTTNPVVFRTKTRDRAAAMPLNDEFMVMQIMQSPDRDTVLASLRKRISAAMQVTLNNSEVLLPVIYSESLLKMLEVALSTTRVAKHQIHPELALSLCTRKVLARGVEKVPTSRMARFFSKFYDDVEKNKTVHILSKNGADQVVMLRLDDYGRLVQSAAERAEEAIASVKKDFAVMFNKMQSPAQAAAIDRFMSTSDDEFAPLGQPSVRKERRSRMKE